MKSLTSEEKTESLRLLKDVLSIPTVNGINNELELAMYIKKYLQNYGIESIIQDVDNKHVNLFADIEGENNDKFVVWNGHLDTVPYGNLEEWKTNPKEPFIQDGKVIARGAADMKSGLAAMIFAICSMKKSKERPFTSIHFIATCDEEKDGTGASKFLEKDMLGEPSAIIIGEPSDLNVGIAQKGCLWLKIIIKGITSHGAYPWEGINAIQYGYKICQELREFIQSSTHPLLKKATAEITNLNGGVAPNMIPDYCEIVMDIRYTPDLRMNTILKKLEDICIEYSYQFNGKLQASYKILNHRIGIETPGNNHWVESLHKSIANQGICAQNIGINYFSDASIFIKNKPDIPVILFGPGCPDMAHKPNEYVEIDKYYQSIEILKNFISVRK